MRHEEKYLRVAQQTVAQECAAAATTISLSNNQSPYLLLHFYLHATATWKRTMMTLIHKERSEVVRRVSVDFTSISAASASSPSPNSSLKKEQQTFPFKLFEMIKYANDSGCSSLLSWSPDGKTFYIHDKDAMMNDLAPRFFNQTKFRSFVSVLSSLLHRLQVAVTFIVCMCMSICCCLGIDYDR